MASEYCRQWTPATPNKIIAVYYTVAHSGCFNKKIKTKLTKLIVMPKFKHNRCKSSWVIEVYTNQVTSVLAAFGGWGQASAMGLHYPH